MSETEDVWQRISDRLCLRPLRATAEVEQTVNLVEEVPDPPKEYAPKGLGVIATEAGYAVVPEHRVAAGFLVKRATAE